MLEKVLDTQQTSVSILQGHGQVSNCLLYTLNSLHSANARWMHMLHRLTSTTMSHSCHADCFLQQPWSAVARMHHVKEAAILFANVVQHTLICLQAESLGRGLSCKASC